MDGFAVPRKCIQLSELPIKDSKTRRLFILADGQRSSSEIFKLSLIDEQIAMKLLQSLLDEGYLRVAETSPSPSFLVIKKAH